MKQNEREYLARITGAINKTDVYYLAPAMLREWKGQLYLALLQMFDGCSFTDYVEELERIAKL